MFLIADPWPETDRQRAEALGCEFMEVPLYFSLICEWIEQVMARTPADRRSVDLPGD